MDETGKVAEAEPQSWGLLRTGAGRMLWPLLALSAIAFFLALHYLRPAPPDTLTIASGSAGSRFNLMALRYQKILNRSGITLKVLTTEGALDNLNRLHSRNSGVDIALVQSGIEPASDAGDLVSLGSVFYIPLTIFYQQHRMWMTRSYAVALVFFEVRLISGVLGFDDSLAAGETIVWICLAFAIPLADVILQIQDSRRARLPTAV